MSNSTFTRLAHVAGVAYSIVFVIHKTNVEIVKFVAQEFAPTRNREAAKTVGDALDEIKDGLTDEEKAAVDEAFENEIYEFWKTAIHGDLTKKTED